MKTLVSVVPGSLAPLVNVLFRTICSEKASVVVHQTEIIRRAADGSVIQRRMDTFFEVEEHGESARFRLEAESAPDRTIVLRFWEYDTGSLVIETKFTDNWNMDVRLPRSGLIACVRFPESRTG